MSYPGIPGPCEILKGVGVEETTTTKVIFHQSLWGKLEVRLRENKDTHNFLHVHIYGIRF